MAGNCYLYPLSTDQSLQIGIEIEFLAPRDTEFEEKYNTEIRHGFKAEVFGDACHRRIAENLHEAELGAAFELDTPAEYGDFALYNPVLSDIHKSSIVNKDVVVLGPHEDIDRTIIDGAIPYKYWVVKPEDDISYLHSDEEDYVKTELNTPIIPEHDALPGGRLAGLDTVLDIIAETDTLPFHLNRTCGLHVHVSPALGGNLLFIKRVSTLVMAIENSMLFTLCSPQRRRVQQSIMNSENLSHEHSYLAARTPMPDDALENVPESMLHPSSEGLFMRRVWSTRDMMELARAVECPMGYTDRGVPALMFKFAPRADGGRSCTLEFRHAQASLSTAFIQSWTHVVLAVCRVALLPADQFKQALDELWDLMPSYYNEEADRYADEAIWLKQMRVLNQYYLLAGGQALDEAYWVQRVQDMRHNDGNLDFDADGVSLF